MPKRKLSPERRAFEAGPGLRFDRSTQTLKRRIWDAYGLDARAHSKLRSLASDVATSIQRCKFELNHPE